MIRFQPDTWRDALLRPIAMAAPDSGVYLEVMAPDMRYVALLLLTAASLLLLLLRRRMLPRCTALLLAFVWLAFVPWLVTTGNGRYFLPVLVVTGPLCVALIARLPGTPGLRVALAGLLVLVQGSVVVLNDPRGSWGLAPWLDRYFEVQLTAEERDQPGAYVLISNISYSAVAPLFHPGSRWIGLGGLGSGGDTPDERRAQAMLAQVARENLPLKLLVPSIPKYMGADLQPKEELRAEINRLIADRRLALQEVGACKLLPSMTIAREALGDLRQTRPELVRKLGFWVCPLRYPVAPPPAPAPVPEIAAIDLVLDRLELACPRLFPPGEARTVRIGDGFVRTYPSTDLKSYVLDNSEVWFAYWRALNSNLVGTRAQVMAEGFRLDCNSVNGRSGLPWERKL